MPAHHSSNGGACIVCSALSGARGGRGFAHRGHPATLAGPTEEPLLTPTILDPAAWILDELDHQLDEGATFDRDSAELRLTEAGASLRRAHAGSEPELFLNTPAGTTTLRWDHARAGFFGGSQEQPLAEILRSHLPSLPDFRPRLLHVSDLRITFQTDHGPIRAVDGLDFSITPGEALGLVGASGSGKTVTGLGIVGLLPEQTARIPTGSVRLMGCDLLTLPKAALRTVRGQAVGMVFQEPMSSLNPVFTIGEQIAEALRHHHGTPQREARERTLELLREVGIEQPQRCARSHPHQLSGGQQQRAMIAMALCTDPQLLIADEPTTALDVVVQRQILDLLARLREDREMAMLFITHDLAVVGELANRVAILDQGRIVEQGPTSAIFASPSHPTTRDLLARPAPCVEEPADLGHPAPPSTDRPLLEVEQLSVWFPASARSAPPVKAVDGVSLALGPGANLGLVGRSGCGKTTLGRAILRLRPPREGRIRFEGASLQDLDRRLRRRNRLLLGLFGAGPALTAMSLLGMTVAEIAIGPPLLASALVPALIGLGCGLWALGISDPQDRELRRKIQVIFQNPHGSLNPRQTVAELLIEPMKVHRIGRDRSERLDRARALLQEVGLDPSHLDRYPHAFSGGQRQRICIARALAVEPSLIICDEPVSALDVAIRTQVLDLLRQLQRSRGISYLFISHDLSVVQAVCEELCVMDEGRIVEAGPTHAIFSDPQHPATRRLIDAIPRLPRRPA